MRACKYRHASFKNSTSEFQNFLGGTTALYPNFFPTLHREAGGDLLHIPCHIRRLDLRTFGFCFVPSFLPRDAMQAQPMSSRGVSVCVRLSRLYILSKRINISSIFLPSGSQAILVCPHQSTKRHGDIPTRTRHPNGSVECRLGRQKSRF